MNDKLETIKSWLGEGSINLFGRPFCGKDTQGEKLVEVLNGTLISGGQILRSTENKEVLDIISAGNLLPSDMFKDIVIPYLSRDEFKGKAIILDAIGRKSGEEKVILESTNSSNHPLKAVVHIIVSDDEVWRRFDASQETHDRGDRGDDSKDVIQTRLDQYQQETMPVINFYKELGLLIEVNGDQSREEVLSEIISKLAERAQA